MRNEEQDIDEFMKSLINLRPKWERLVCVNDGSSDKTRELLEQWQNNCSLEDIVIVNRNDRGFSALGTELMADVYNDGYAELIDLEWDYLIIVSPDTFLPANYLEQIIPLMRSGNVVVASGLPDGEVNINLDHATGSGRVIAREIMDFFNGFPRNYAWESSMFNIAWMKGYNSRHYPEIPYHQSRGAGGSGRRSYVGWGRGMKDLGCIFSYMVLRTLTDLYHREFRKALHMFYGYMTRKYVSNPASDWLRSHQRNRMWKKIKAKLRIKK